MDVVHPAVELLLIGCINLKFLQQLFSVSNRSNHHFFLSVLGKEQIVVSFSDPPSCDMIINVLISISGFRLDLDGVDNNSELVWLLPQYGHVDRIDD